MRVEMSLSFYVGYREVDEFLLTKYQITEIKLFPVFVLAQYSCWHINYNNVYFWWYLSTF